MAAFGKAAEAKLAEVVTRGNTTTTVEQDDDQIDWENAAR